MQRVSECSVTIDGAVYSSIESGLMILVGVESVDGDSDIDYLVQKISQMRIFGDEDGVMNLSLLDVGGDVMMISQFTLHAQTKKGNRPSYIKSAPAAISKPLYEQFVKRMEQVVGRSVATGVFGADMKVSLVNDGPVTIIIDSQNRA